MKRLLRKIASGNLELYHTTSSQVLEKIKEAGSVLPNASTGVTSNGFNGGESLNENGIYLCNDEYVLNQYRESAVNNTIFDQNIPNISVDLKLNVNTENLLPDYDDMAILLEDPKKRDELDSLFEENVPRWQTSLDEIEQCVHNGPIELDKIVGVKFSTKWLVLSGFKLDILDEYLKFDTWITIDEAINQLNELKVGLANLEPTAAFSRLRKLVAKK